MITVSRRLQCYECVFCKKLFRNKTPADKHELICTDNPKSKNCYVCNHYDNAICDVDKTPTSKFRGIDCKNFSRNISMVKL